MDRPQLRMIRRNLKDLPPLEMPEGFGLRFMRDGEGMRWGEILNSVKDLGEWTKERVEENLRERIRPDHVFFITQEDEPVATTCIVLHQKDEGIEAELGWVAVRPDRQGKRLGYFICLAVMHEIQKLGFDEVFLLTDDHRLPALKTYLNLNFEPDCWHESHAGRWEEIYKILGWKG